MSLLLKAIHVPNLRVDKIGQAVAQQVAKDFSEFIDSVAEGYNTSYGTSITAAEGLIKLMDSDYSFQRLLDENPQKVAIVKSMVSQRWGKAKGFSKGYLAMRPIFARWFTYHVLTKYRPDLAKAIIEHPKGEQWMEETVKAMRQLLWNK
jgi:hypothetical protein